MIKPEIYYEVTCDECGEQFCDGDTIIAFGNEREAIDAAYDAGWIGLGSMGLNKIVCPDCLEKYKRN